MKKEGLGRSLKKSKPRPQWSSRGPIESILEESQVDDYVNYSKATDGIILIHSRADNPHGLPSVEETLGSVPCLTVDSGQFSMLPKKPSWEGVHGEAIEYQQLEEREFYKWRTQLASLESSNSHLIMTPFERSLNIWRELWRCVERSDVLFQVLDARNPLFFLCQDLFAYSRDVRPSCRHFIILNKADLLTAKQRQAWSEYFTTEGLEHVFFSNLPVSTEAGDLDKCRVISPSELSDFIAELVDDPKGVAGFVGYPNVGKSSTINSIMGVSRAAVSATPGKTKHIQTFETAHFSICDCPGLVFPNMAASKAELILNGVLSIDHMREYLSPVELLCQRIPIAVFESVYNVRIALEHNVSLAESVLSAYSRSRGMFTSNFGNPDMSKGSRVLLKDYVSGLVLFCYPPPGIPASDFNAERPLMTAPAPDFSVVHDPIKIEMDSPVSIRIMNNRRLPAADNGKKHNKMNKRR